MRSGSQDQSVDVLVEIPRGSRAKYEMDQKTGRIRLDRVLFSSVHYPADYGFVPDTLSLDVKDKVVLVLRYFPEDADPKTKGILARYADLRYKAMAARQRLHPVGHDRNRSQFRPALHAASTSLSETEPADRSDTMPGSRVRRKCAAQ